MIQPYREARKAAERWTAGSGEGYTITMNCIKIFDQFDIDAGFTTRETTADIKRLTLVDTAKKNGGSVIRPLLVHGDSIAVIKEESEPYIEIPDTDGCITNVSGVTLTSTHGDCLAVYAYDKKTGAAGLCHAGWKGTRLGIAYNMIIAMNKEFKATPRDISCYISPGISECCFEVDADVKDAFMESIPWSSTCIRSAAGEKYYIDLKEINRIWLNKAGTADIKISPLCTCCRSDMFYSYRRSKDTERMLAWISCR